MSIPKEPRQLMINLMYLVLTAMLALNITKEVLDAFSTINTSIESSNAGIADKNKRLYQAFEHIADKKPDLKPRADSLYAKALLVKEMSDQMSAKLEDWKSQIVSKAGGWVEDPNGNGARKVKIMDDIDIASRMFIEEKNGATVKSQLEGFINDILSKAASAEDREDLRKQIPLKLNDVSKTDANPSGDWSFGTFHNIPVIAAITLFSKWQSDVKNTESVMIENLMKQVGDDPFDPDLFKIDGLMPVAVPSTSYALEGDEITANVTLAAYNKSAKPVVSSNVGAVTVQDGVGVIKFKAHGTGVQTVKGTISLATKGKQNETQPWSFTYTVGSAGASLQLDKMNVMYIGVKNPVTLSASGYNIDDVTWNMEGAKIEKSGKGTYDVTVTTPNYKGVPYTISAKNKMGQTVKVGGGSIRIKNIPTPNVMFGTIDGSGTMTAGEISVQKGLAAILENFDFDYKYLVTRYRLLRIARGSDEAEVAEGNGPLFSSSPAVKSVLNKCKPGDRLIFEQIYVQGTGNPPRPAKGAINVLVR